MSRRQGVEEALRGALRHEEASLKRRLPQVLARSTTPASGMADSSAARISAESAEREDIRLGKSDQRRLKRLRKRLADTHVKPDNSVLWRAALLALESHSADDIAALIAGLPTLKDKPQKPLKGKTAKKTKA